MVGSLGQFRGDRLRKVRRSTENKVEQEDEHASSLSLEEDSRLLSMTVIKTAFFYKTIVFVPLWRIPQRIELPLAQTLGCQSSHLVIFEDFVLLLEETS